MRIVIPTLGRINEQHTYNALPQKYKDEVKFIVQPHEYDEMASIYGEQVLCLPEGINKIAATRNWIMHEFKDYRYMCFDDDMQGFVIKEPYILDGKEKWKSRNFEESDFDDWFNHVEKWMDEGYVHGAMLPATIKPVSGRWPYQANFRIVKEINIMSAISKIIELKKSIMSYSTSLNTNLYIDIDFFSNKRISRIYNAINVSQKRKFFDSFIC